MKKTDAYSDLSQAQKLERCYLSSRERDNFCYVSFRKRVEDRAASYGPWGYDDTMYWFDDGSMLLERKIVKEWQLFKA